MKKKANRLDAIKMIISSKDVSSQEELLQALSKEGFELTQATLSRDLKQLKVAKAANMNGKYVYGRHPYPARICQQHGLRHRQPRVSRHSGYHCRR